MIVSVFRIFILSTLLISAGFGQSRHNARGVELESSILNVTVLRTGEKKEPIKIEDLFLYEDGIEQRIRNFTHDPSPSRIVLLVDNSQTLPLDMEKIKQAALEFAYEIYDGDQLFVIAYDEGPEIIQEWTDSAEKMQVSLGTFRKKGNPHLFDALHASVREVLLPLMPGTRKTAVVVIGDGLDRGSKTNFDNILAELQELNVTVYALQAPDRTGGAYRRNQPKAGVVISRLTEETGGKAFPIDDAQTAAKYICDELRTNRYLLSYLPLNTSSYQPRRLLLTAGDGVVLRTKTAQPPNIR